MSILDQLASAQKINRDVPNQELAKKLAASQDHAAIRELAENLWNKDSAIQSDCIKTLYEIGYLAPALIAEYALEFLKLLRSKNNRLVWGGMIALSTVAALKADELYPHVAEIQKAMEKGSVITVDGGVLVLAKIAAANPAYNQAIFPYLLENYLRTCRPKDVPANAERILLAVNAENKAAFIAALETRLDNATPSQLARLKRVIKKADRA
jgi:hypothetical protein